MNQQPVAYGKLLITKDTDDGKRYLRTAAADIDAEKGSHDVWWYEAGEAGWLSCTKEKVQELEADMEAHLMKATQTLAEKTGVPAELYKAAVDAGGAP